MAEPEHHSQLRGADAPLRGRLLTFGVKILAVIICLMVAGCTTAQRSTREEPAGTFFAEIRLTAGALSGVEKSRTGFAFYIEENDGIAGPRLTGYRYKRGERVQTFGGGSDSADTVRALRFLGLRPFDFSAEVKLCASRLETEAKARGEEFLPPFVLDGAEYEIVIATPDGQFRLKEWNPGFAIDYYSPHSSDIAKLKKTLDALSQYYGHLEFGI